MFLKISNKFCNCFFKKRYENIFRKLATMFLRFLRIITKNRKKIIITDLKKNCLQILRSFKSILAKFDFLRESIFMIRFRIASRIDSRL